MKKHRFFYLAVMMLFLLYSSSCDNACQNAVINTKQIEPSGLLTTFTSANDHATFSCFPFTCFQTNGTGPEFTPAAGEIIVGYDGNYDDGTWPCDCWEWSSHAYRGAVMFDVSKFKKIVSATLIFHVGQGHKGDGDAASNETDAISGMFLGTGSIPTGSHFAGVPNFPPVGQPFLAPFPKASDVGTEFPKSGFSIKKNGPDFSIDVTVLVSNWIQGKDPNNGFVFVGHDESLPGEVNHTFATTYSDFKLEITFNPNEQ